MPKPDKSKGQRDRVRVIDDERKRSLELRPMELVPPSVGIFDEPTRCYRINHEWAKIVTGLVSWLATVAAWRDASEDNYFAITEILRFLEGDNCDMPFQLRQNPTNSCLIEQSTDGGETWLTAFDLSLCMSIVDGSSQTSIEQNFVVSNYETFQEYVYNNYVNNYINNVTDIAPELGYTGGALDDFRDAALCYALDVLVDAVCEGAIRYISEREETANDLKNTLALTAAIVGIVAIAATGVGLVALAGGATLWGAGIGIGAALGSALVDKWADASIDTYEDESAKEDVVCCLFDALKGANFNQSNFIDAFDNNCGLTGNAAEIFDTTAAFARENATYASMVEKLRIGYNSAQLGLLPNCGCDDGYSMLDFQFDEAQFYFKALTGEWQGTYFEGFQSTITGAQRSNMTIQRKFSGENIKVVGVGIHYESNENCGITGVNAQFYLAGELVGGFGQSPGGAGVDRKLTWGVTSAPNGFFADEIRVNLQVTRCGGDLAIGRFKAIRIWLDTDSPVRGIEVTTAPIGTGALGSTDPQWWI